MATAIRAVPTDQMTRALVHAFTALVDELQKKDIVSAAVLAEGLKQSAKGHRTLGDPARMANALDALSQHLLVGSKAKDPPSRGP